MSDVANRAAADAVFTTNAAVAIGASTIPLVGGPIATAIGIWEGERISRRVEALVEELRGQMASLDAEKVDQDYIGSGGFQDVVVAAIQAAKRTSSAAKRSWIVAVLSGAITGDRPKDLGTEALLEMLATTTDRELAILRFMWTHRAPDDRVHAMLVPTDLQGQDFNFHLARLEAAGLLVYEVNRPIAGSDDWRIFGSTPTMHRLMTLVEAGGGLPTAPTT